jgi:vacuolar-type H+-ATPase subunit C/Vma6
MKDPVVKEIYTAKADYINVSLSLRLRDYKKAKEQFVQGGTILESGLKTLCEEGKETLKEKAKTITSKLDILLAVNAFADNMPFSEFERVSEGYAVRLLSKRKYEQSGIIPFINYCFMKETEYRNVRIALAGIINGMDKADIKRRLRDTYEG